MENRYISDRDNKAHYLFCLSKGLGKACVRKVIGRNRYSQKTYLGASILQSTQANAFIRQAILEGKPFMAARFGDGELRAVVYYLNRVYGLTKEYPDYIRVALERNAGFFPATQENMDQFGELMLRSCEQIDVLAVWFNLMEDYIYGTFGPKKKQCIYLKALEPFWSESPWTGALAGKKVLVIHPFAETIEKQYSHRENLFQNIEILPEFELRTLKAVQSIGGTSDIFNTWFDALEWMYHEAMNIDFDIALIGCGAYGLPLAAKLKNAGKMAIHLGGVTQFLFGIKGGRWDSRPDYAAFYNDSWVRPLESEKPKSADQVENGCYW